MEAHKIIVAFALLIAACALVVFASSCAPADYDPSVTVTASNVDGMQLDWIGGVFRLIDTRSGYICYGTSTGGIWCSKR